MNTLFIGFMDTILAYATQHNRSFFYNPDKSSRSISFGGNFLSVIMY